MITSLKSNQIFVFGSNLNGYHLGGAANQAYEYFGAVWGQGEGLFGNSYAFPTLDENFQQRTLDQLIISRNRLYATARANKDKEFLLTPVGTGIAGFKLSVIQKLFIKSPSNITKLF